MPQASTVYSLLLSEVMISLIYEQQKHILIPLLSHPKLTSWRQGVASHTTSLHCLCPSKAASLSQHMAALPILPQLLQQSIPFSHSRHCNQVKFLLIKTFSNLHACTGKLGDDIWTQLQAHKPVSSIKEVGIYFSLVIFLPALWFIRIWVMIFECCQGWQYWPWASRAFDNLIKGKWGLELVMLMLFSAQASQACGASQQNIVPWRQHAQVPSLSCPSQPSPGGHMWDKAILHGCKSKTQSCPSQESMRIFAFGIFMETGSCPKHIPREWIFQKYEFSLPHTKTLIVRPSGTPQQNIGKRKR